MSDFLSKFSKNNYKETIENEEKQANEKQESVPENLQENTEDTESEYPIAGNSESQVEATSDDYSQETEDLEDDLPEGNQEEADSWQEEELAAEPSASVEPGADTYGAQLLPSSPDSRTSRREDSLEEVEVDPTYRKRKRRNIILSVLGSVLGIALIYFIYHNAVHLEMEDFVGMPVSEARTWASEHDLELELEQEYSTEYDTNLIISQNIAEGETIRKGSTLYVVSSQGPDPDELLPLPDFSEMTQREMEIWIGENHAANINMLTEYSDEVEEGRFVRLEFRDSSITESEYRRRDRATVYFSRGAEVFEKDIEVPNFTGQMRAEVEQWAASNSVEVTYEEETSDDVDMDTIISQSISPEEMIAKTDKIEVVVSLGKAIKVPNFANLSMEEAQSQTDLAVTMRQQFHSSVSYGRLISQSVEAGTELLATDDTSITVIYSAGRPYLRDYHGQLEGDLPRLFYEDYQSQGANITYTVKTVDSSEPKGTVVGMSKFNEFVPMDYTVKIEISNNALPATAPAPEPEPEPEPEDEPEDESSDDDREDKDEEKDS